MSDASAYFVYLLKCADGTFYAGVTTDIARRLQEHNSEQKGARYTKSRRPVTLVYSEAASGRSAAQQREYQVRNLTRVQKQALIKNSG